MVVGKLVVAVTGASGAIYAQRFLRAACPKFAEIYLTLSPQARQVAKHELGVDLDGPNPNLEAWLGVDGSAIRLMDPKDYFTPPASGSFLHDGMVIVPCSMGAVGRIAHGISDDLTTRAADVCLKEKRPLIVVPRESPMNLVMLRNLVTLAEAGATVIPAAPAWYHRPRTPEQLADTIVARVLQALGVSHDLHGQWMTEE